MLAAPIDQLELYSPSIRNVRLTAARREIYIQVRWKMVGSGDYGYAASIPGTQPVQTCVMYFALILSF